MNDNTDEQIKKRLNEIFPSPEVAAKMVDIVVGTRPRGVSRNSNFPYYKEFYAKQIRADIDKMIESGKDLVYRYETYCDGPNCTMSRMSLYQKINQSLRFLIEEIDTPDKKYNTWHKLINVRKEQVGIAIRFIPEYRVEDAALTLGGELIIPANEVPMWKRRMEDWLEGDDQTPFVQERLALSVEQVRELKLELSKLVGIMSSITTSSIKIIRVKQ